MQNFDKVIYWVVLYSDSSKGSIQNQGGIIYFVLIFFPPAVSLKNPKNHSNPAQPSSTADSGRLSSAGKRGKGYQELDDGEEVLWIIKNNMKVVNCKTWSVSKSLVAPEGTVRQRLLKVWTTWIDIFRNRDTTRRNSDRILRFAI